MIAAGVPCSRYRSLGEAMTDPHSVARGVMARVPDAAGGFLVPNPPFQFADGTVGVVPSAPKLGEHTDELLANLV